MSALANLATNQDIQDETDNLGGGGPWETGLYPCTVAMAYVGTSEGGATSITVHLKNSSNREMRETLWVASGNAKGNKNYYEDKDGNKQYLPGFNTANSLSLLTVGKELSQLTPEKKTIKLWNSDAKAEVPTEVDVLTELLDQPVIAAVFKQIVDKTAKGDDGKYHPTGETREENEISKFFRERDRMSTFEIRNKAEKAEFADAWDAKWSGQTRDRSTKQPAGTGGNTSTAFGSAAAANNKPTESLFD